MLTEFQPADLALTATLLACFTRKRTGQRLNTVSGSTDRNRLIVLLQANADLIKKMRQQLRPYKNSPAKHEVWERFQGYTKLIILGEGGPKGGAPAKPAA